MVVCFEIEENLEKKSNSLGLARRIIYVRKLNGSKIEKCQLVNQLRPVSNYRNHVNKAISGNLVEIFFYRKNESRAVNR